MYFFWFNIKLFNIKYKCRLNDPFQQTLSFLLMQKNSVIEHMVIIVPTTHMCEVGPHNNNTTRLNDRLPAVIACTLFTLSVAFRMLNVTLMAPPKQCVG